MISLCSNEDADPDVLQLLLENKKNENQVNYRLRGVTLKWRNIHRVARFMIRYNLASSGLFNTLAQDSGSTAIHYAVKRGDIDVVNLLLRHGADCSIKDDLGKSPVDYCDAFPELKGALKRAIRQEHEKKTVFRRLSTASNMKYPMYLIPLYQLHRLYGGKDSRHERIEAHQKLKRRRELVSWEDLPIDAHIIFLSHEWVGWNHPDPHGIQLKTFLRVMKRLESGEISKVEMNSFHTLLYKANRVVHSEEWKEILSTAYVWIDWASMPQPSACPPTMSQKEKNIMRKNMKNAVDSIPAYVIFSNLFNKQTNINNFESRYVEKADFVAIVAPGCLHADRRDPETELRTKTCYRTYRTRGWCVLEVFAAYLSRDKRFPSLLITSKEATPEWISSLNIINLAVGTSNFTCCQCNHIFRGDVVSCDRGITRKILERMIKAKVKHYFSLQQTLYARFCASFSNWWLRTESSSVEESHSDSLISFKKSLWWDKNDKEWHDEDGIPILVYAVIKNDIEIVRELLKIEKCRKTSLNNVLFRNGPLLEFGIPAKVYILYIAMGFANVQIVEMLLENGADPCVVDKNGFDPVMIASTLGRSQNIKLWLKRFPHWNINRGNSMNGSTALHCAVFLGQNKMDTVLALVESGQANLNVLSSRGASLLSNAVASVDSNVDIVRYLLSNETLNYGVNYRRKPVTLKWKVVYTFARVLFQMNIVTSGIFANLASDLGATSLQYAVRRGDAEIVEILMRQGNVNPFSKNDIGRNALSYCGAFPEIKSAIERVQLERSRFQSSKATMKSTKSFSLQRRVSTAIFVSYDMYLMSLSTMINLFGDEKVRKKNLRLYHQDLLEKGKLTRFEDLPLGAFVIFVSHQWNGFEHPDSKGVQIECMVNTFRRLRDGSIDRVDTDPFHTILYKKNRVTERKEWMQLLSNAYVFYDFWCQPQVFTEGESEDISHLYHQRDLSIESLGGYVERADCVVILVPSTTHEDRINKYSGRHEFTCYRTYRRRAFCVFEMMATHLSRRKTHPMLLVRSSHSIPQWISSLESHKLVVGESIFLCCELNHKGFKFKTCLRGVLRKVLNTMILKKVEYLFDFNNVIYARLNLALRSWFLRGLSGDDDDDDGYSKCKMKQLRAALDWDTSLDNTWFDRGGISLLFYAIVFSNVEVVKSLLENLDKMECKKERRRRLVSEIPREGFVEAGITGKMNALSVAMFMSTPEVVGMLLDRGFDPMLSDVAGNHPFLFACISNQVRNVQYWLKRFPDWNLEARNSVIGGVALGCAVYMGPNRFELVSILLKAGARLDTLVHAGGSILTALVSNEDSDPQVLKLLLSHYKNINYQIRATTFKWKLIHLIAKTAVRVLKAPRGLLRSLASDSGSTALHYAALRGDIEIVELLLGKYVVSALFFFLIL